MVSKYSSDELLQMHMDFWKNKKPIMNTEYSLTARFRHVPSLPPEWRTRDFILEPQMLSPEKLQPAPITMDLTCGPVFNTICPFWRVPWLSGIVGCQLRVSNRAETVFAKPPVDKDWHKKTPIRIPVNNAWLDKLLEFTRYVIDHYHKRMHAIATLDMIGRGPGDILAQLMGPENLYISMFTHPEETKELLSQITDIIIEWASAQFEMIPKFHDGYCNLYGIWSPGTSIRFQEDLAINLSPKLFKEFLLPFDEKIIKRFDYHVFHTHSGYSKLAEIMADVKDLGAIEMSIDPNGPGIEDLLPIWANLLRKKPLIISGWITSGQLEMITAKLPKGGLLMDVVVIEPGQKLDFFSYTHSHTT